MCDVKSPHSGRKAMLLADDASTVDDDAMADDAREGDAHHKRRRPGRNQTREGPNDGRFQSSNTFLDDLTLMPCLCKE